MIFVVFVIINKQYGSHFAENVYIDCWMKNDYWKFGITMFIDLGLILHCFVIIYSCYDNYNYQKETFNIGQTIKSYQRNIMKNYYKFIAIYVILWIPAMVLGILDVTIGANKIPFWMKISESGFIIFTGIANGIIWHTNKGTYATSKKLINIINQKSPTILIKNEKRICINNSKIETNTFKALSGINIDSNMNTETITSSKPLDYDPASKIGPRSMYNCDDYTPTMMLIDNTVNEYKYDITSVIVSEGGPHREVSSF